MPPSVLTPERAASDLVAQVDSARLAASRTLDSTRKALLGQFFTPAPVARLMASMLDVAGPVIRLLDPGAGTGALFAACVAEWCRWPQPPAQVHVTAYEVDSGLIPYLRETLALCKAACEQADITFTSEVRNDDFIRDAVTLLRGDLFTPASAERYNCAILNPPYRKIQTASEHRRLLQRIGIETTNLYTGFLATTVQLLEPTGAMVAITPRSFCNGPYFKHFRRFFLGAMTLRRLHLFESRDEAFRDDAVLQENIILAATRSTGTPETIAITSSADPEDGLLSARDVPYTLVVSPADPHAFIHIVPDALGQAVNARLGALRWSLASLGVSVSTGRVVDFRARDYLRPQPEAGTAPLIYPAHFASGYVAWPNRKTRKPNALVIADQTRPQLVRNAIYVLVKRFSAKEERRRIVAAVYDGQRVPGEAVGFENHLNYFHCGGAGLDLTLARGLAAFLNSTLVDEHFRQFNGHTQVNATDLRNIHYPSLAQLQALGARIGPVFLGQHDLDDLIEEELFGMTAGQGINPVRAKERIAEAVGMLKALGLPRAQQNERSALTLLALLDIGPETPWAVASAPLRGITQMMDYFRDHYGKNYAPNTRETVRRQTVHQFVAAGLLLQNPDQPDRPTNSGKTVYQIEPGALELLRSYETPGWEANLGAYLASMETLAKRYARERRLARIPIQVAEGNTITLSPGGQNVLVKEILAEFASRYTPGGIPLYVGDTDEKFAYYDEAALATLGVAVEAHGKMPDVIIHHQAKDWLVLIEAVTSHGPVDAKRRDELQALFRDSTAGLVFVTAFLTRKAMTQYLPSIAWATEVWVAEAPDHLIHFNGERFLGPDEETSARFT